MGLAALIRQAVTDFDAVTLREVASRQRFLDELGRLADPCNRDADPVHVTGSAIIAGRRGTVLHLHKRVGDDIEPCPAPGESPHVRWFSLADAIAIADEGLDDGLARLR